MESLSGPKGTYDRLRMCTADSLAFGAFTLTLTHILAETFFPRGHVGEGVHNTQGNPEAWGLFLCSKNDSSGEAGGGGLTLNSLHGGLWDSLR